MVNEPAPGDDLEAVVRRTDLDRWLASRFIADPAARADVLTLYAFDHELARATRVASNRLIAEIRLTWWAEVLDEAYSGALVRAHPVAQGLAATVRRRRLPREPLEAMIDARIEGLDRAIFDAAAAMRWADGVGGSAAVLAATILDPDAPAEAAAPAGRLWGVVLLSRLKVIKTGLLAERIRSGLPQARRAASRLGVAAFPAVAHVSLVRGMARTRDEPLLIRQSRLLWAVATGRL